MGGLKGAASRALTAIDASLPLNASRSALDEIPPTSPGADAATLRIRASRVAPSSAFFASSTLPPAWRAAPAFFASSHEGSGEAPAARQGVWRRVPCRQARAVCEKAAGPGCQTPRAPPGRVGVRPGPAPHSATVLSDFMSGPSVTRGWRMNFRKRNRSPLFSSAAASKTWSTGHSKGSSISPRLRAVSEGGCRCRWAARREGLG